MPASDAFLSSAETATVRYPLELALCNRCSLLQILETIDPKKLFGNDYLYCSSVATSWLELAKDNASQLIRRFKLKAEDRVVELASNDGYLLQYFLAEGIDVLGVDPAPVPAAIARERGIPTEQAFFSEALGDALALSGKRARLVIANNVLAHVADLHDFLRGILAVMLPEGVLVAEVPWALSLLNGCAFDTIYHEHLCYFSLQSLGAVLASHSLFLNDVEELPSHGGSLRIYASRDASQSEALREALHKERMSRLDIITPYECFAQAAVENVRALSVILQTLSEEGCTLAAYGAAAKGTMLLNCLGSGSRQLRYVIDRNPAKQGRFVPGVNIPIVAPEAAVDDPVDCLLLLCWNLKEEIFAQEKRFFERGGRFLLPLPKPQQITWDSL